MLDNDIKWSPSIVYVTLLIWQSKSQDAIFSKELGFYQIKFSWFSFALTSSDGSNIHQTIFGSYPSSLVPFDLKLH